MLKVIPQNKINNKNKKNFKIKYKCNKQRDRQNKNHH